ncbi:hypothetical protein KDC22_24810 [Paenibacillus tritici]|uniref:hypothetical protein n=1 Tax=Paenibacillus tritici TaxID=1873425 RepID=UPI001BA721B7|nr:hypothetical protein [Paenibacillus tritici]QUL53566.1 hypothetical protein KDC22_24810 [Paenibacillus tritici]
MAQTLVEYARSFHTNLSTGVIMIPVPSTATLILEFGMAVPAAPSNYVELTTTVGWEVTNVFATPPDQPKLLLEVLVDGILVGSAQQSSISNDEDEPLRMTTMFQTILTDLPEGYYPVQVFATNLEDLQGDIILRGPILITGKVIAPV